MSPPPDVSLPAVVADQVAYHLRMSAACALSGAADESASEAVLAWTVFVTGWSDAAERAARAESELISRDVLPPSDEARSRATTRARALALDLEGHFVSVGQQAEADLYAQVAEHLDASIGALS